MEKTAVVTYYHHSGFTVEVMDTLLVFDYWRGENGELPEKVQLREQDLAGHKRVLVFVSHSHEDHFDDIIYSWDYQRLGITYIISDDLPIGKRGKRVKPGDTLTVGDAEIRVFDSTDKGVSFYVSLYGLNIFHAGDLNLWHWREESTLREIAQAEKDFYAAMAPIDHLPMDIAMFPVDPRMGGLYEAGANYFVMSVKPRVFLPMHWQGRAEVAQSYARKSKTRYTEVLALTQPREQAELTFLDDQELHIHISAPMPETSPEESEGRLDGLVGSDPFANSDLPVQL
ncbi:MAG: MBL fold metallo-hydrolase [Clostridia bacterium]|nr:MBL fold metallo-hydrolase [Clostridia bacterium]